MRAAYCEVSMRRLAKVFGVFLFTSSFVCLPLNTFSQEVTFKSGHAIKTDASGKVYQKNTVTVC